MSIILDRVCDVQRITKDATNSNKESYQVYTPLANIPINIQPGTAEDTVIAGGTFGHTWVGFTTYSGILSADKLVFQLTGEVLIVRGKQNWMSPDNIPHIELLLTEFETTE